MLTLTDEDRAAILRIAHSHGSGARLTRVEWKDGIDIDEPSYASRDIYLAGLRAGLERAAKVCEAGLVNRPDDPPANYFDGGLRHCSAAIRALID